MDALKVETLADGAASQSGIRIGDHLVSYNGLPLATSEDLSAAMDRFAGQVFKVGLYRGDDYVELDLPAGRLGLTVVAESFGIDRDVSALSTAYRRYLDLIAAGKYSIADVLGIYVGYRIGINLSDPGKIELAYLTGVHADHFVTEVAGLSYHLPYHQVIRVVASTSKDGTIRTGGFFSGVDVPLIVKVFDFVIYKGAVGAGISVPIGG